MQRVCSLVLFAGLLGAIGVGIGAIGAHGLPEYFEKQGLAPEAIAKKLVQCETAVRYQLIHVCAILAIGLFATGQQRRLLAWAGWSMVAGVCLFSGGLYSLVFLGVLGHWAIIPSGGMLMILGWILVAVAGLVLQVGINRA